MTIMRVSPGEVADLGNGLSSLADALVRLPATVEADAWALGDAGAAAALADAIGGFRHRRLELARYLTDLSEAAHAAGAAYLEVEEHVGRSLGGGPVR